MAAAAAEPHIGARQGAHREKVIDNKDRAASLNGEA